MHIWTLSSYNLFYHRCLLNSDYSKWQSHIPNAFPNTCNSIFLTKCVLLTASPRRRPLSPSRRRSPVALRGSPPPRRRVDSPPPPPRRRPESPYRRGGSPPPRRRPASPPPRGRSPSPPPRRRYNRSPIRFEFFFLILIGEYYMDITNSN